MDINFFYTESDDIKKNSKPKCDKNRKCKHKFEKDMIDITPEKSLHITYCKLCGFTQ